MVLGCEPEVKWVERKEEDFRQRTQRGNTLRQIRSGQAEVTEKRKGSWMPRSLEKF
jgi:hypothetical protein